MILILVIGLLLGFGSALDLPTKLTEHSQILHSFCLRSLPPAVENRISLEALVCGKSLENLELKQLLVHTSLIHIFIVSGSHFLFLHNILARLVGKRAWVFFPLLAYAMMTLCQPPSVRALIYLMLSETSRRKKLFLSNIQLVFLSVVFSVAFFPQWIFSISLVMSFMAALAMAVSSELFDPKLSPNLRLFLSQSIVHFAMSICLWGLANLHPLGILLNVILGPWIGAGIFPLALLTMLLPPLSVVFDGCMNGLIWMLAKIDPLLQYTSQASPLGILMQWLLVVTILVFSYFASVQRRRRAYEN